MNTGENAAGTDKTVTVKATDPEGIPLTDDDNSVEITVTITVTDVNEPPDDSPTEAAVTFNDDGDIATVLGPYLATDPERVVVDATAWSVAGADGSKFEIDNGDLTFKDKPDFEMPTDTNKDNVYEVTVRAADGDGNRGGTCRKGHGRERKRGGNGNPVEDAAEGWDSR